MVAIPKTAIHAVVGFLEKEALRIQYKRWSNKSEIKRLSEEQKKLRQEQQAIYALLRGIRGDAPPFFARRKRANAPTAGRKG